MNKILLTLICLVFPSFCFSQEDTNFDHPLPHSDAESLFLYGKVNSFAQNPMTGLGVRFKKGYSGFDFSYSLMPMNRLSPLLYLAKASYLFFPFEQGGYFGIGGGIVKLSNKKDGKSPVLEGSVGYQWRLNNQSHIFLEGNFIASYKQMSKSLQNPSPGISLGFGF